MSYEIGNLVIIYLLIDLVGTYLGRRRILRHPKIQSFKIGQKERVLFVAPHCDDEILAAGGLLSRLYAQKNPIKIVYIFRGDLIPYWPKLNSRRQKESCRAIKTIGGKSQDLIFLNRWQLRRQSLKKHAAVKLNKIIFDFKPTIIFVSSRYDSHIGHRLAHDLLRDSVDKHFLSKIKVYEYLVHLKYSRLLRVYPQRHHGGQIKPPKLQESNLYWYNFSLDNDQLSLKRKALGCYLSQKVVPTMWWLFRLFAAKNELFYRR